MPRTASVVHPTRSPSRLRTPSRPEGSSGPAARGYRLALGLALAAGAGLVAGSAGIHLHLWLIGYRRIPAIGPLFLLQAVSGFALATALLFWRRLLVVVGAAGFQLATSVGFLLSASVGLFGFHDSLAAPLAVPALAVEVAGLAALAAAGSLLAWRSPPALRRR
ncbi:MAG: hypothetical protein ACRD0L_08670 [Acidimicrobiales bacterium]